MSRSLFMQAMTSDLMLLNRPILRHNCPDVTAVKREIFPTG